MHEKRSRPACPGVCALFLGTIVALLFGSLSWGLVLPRGMSCPFLYAKPSKLVRIPPLDVPSSKVLQRGNTGEPASLDPTKSSTFSDANILGDMFEGLFKVTKDGKYVLGAASSAGFKRLSNGNYAYYFCLRPKAHWSNGAPVTAHDFVFSFRRLVDPKMGAVYAYALNPVLNAKAIMKGRKKTSELGVKAVGDYLLVITTTEPISYYRQWLAQPYFLPLYAPIVRKYKDFSSNPSHSVTNGAFVLKKWVVNEIVVLEKSMSYWDEKNVKLALVNMYPTINAASALRAFWSGQLDLIPTPNVPFTEVPSILKNPKKKALFYTAPALATYWYSLNSAKPPLTDINLRRALFLAIDQEGLVGDVLHHAVAIADSLVPTGTSNYDVPRKPAMRLSVATLKNCPSFSSVSQKAERNYLYVSSLTGKERRTLALCYYEKAGYSLRHPAKVRISYNVGQNNKLITDVVGSMWDNTLGIKPDLRNQEWKVYLLHKEQVEKFGAKSPLEVMRSSWTGDWDDPSTFLNIFLPHSGNNDPGYHSEAYNRIISKASHTSNLKKRARLLAKAEQILLDSYVIEPIYFYASRFLVHKKVLHFPKSPPIVRRIFDWQLDVDVK